MNRALLVFLVIILLAVGVSLLIPGVRKAIINLGVSYGYLNIADDPPTVQRIFILSSYTGQWEQCPSDDYDLCQKQSTPDSTVTLNMKVEIYDPNGDCDTYGNSGNVKFYVCENTSAAPPCNSINADTDGGTINGAYDTKNGNYCNYTADYTTLDYWKKYGIWRINVTSKDPDNPTMDSITRNWLNVETPTLIYPYPPGDTINLGSVNLDAWTDYAGGNITRNAGNVRINISWQSNNFTCPLCSPQTDIIIDNADNGYNQRFCVNDSLHTPPSCGYFDSLPLNTVWWFPADGVRRCNDDLCSADEDGGLNQANYTSWYHIYITSGKTSGTYNNSITVTHTAFDQPSSCGSGS